MKAASVAIGAQNFLARVTGRTSIPTSITMLAVVSVSVRKVTLPCLNRYLFRQCIYLAWLCFFISMVVTTGILYRGYHAWDLMTIEHGSLKMTAAVRPPSEKECYSARDRLQTNPGPLCKEPETTTRLAPLGPGYDYKGVMLRESGTAVVVVVMNLLMYACALVAISHLTCQVFVLVFDPTVLTSEQPNRIDMQMMFAAFLQCMLQLFFQHFVSSFCVNPDLPTAAPRLYTFGIPCGVGTILFVVWHFAALKMYQDLTHDERAMVMKQIRTEFENDKLEKGLAVIQEDESETPAVDKV